MYYHIVDKSGIEYAVLYEKEAALEILDFFRSLDKDNSKQFSILENDSE